MEPLSFILLFLLLFLLSFLLVIGLVQVELTLINVIIELDLMGIVVLLLSAYIDRLG